MNLIIVESPTKAKTIQHFLPAGFSVKSSFGHVRDLPKGKLGVDVENNFEPKYVVSLLARKRLAEIKKILPKAKKVILATDEDREGEAISWHLTYALDLKGKEIERIVFHEITKKAIEEALKNPRSIDMHMVDAQQARRILDRLVGYELSPFLWKKVAKGLSAGRVQSVAVRLIVEREREIQAFKPDEYWSIVATLLKLKSKNEKVKTEENTENQFEATLIKIDGKQIPKLGIKTKAEAEEITADLEKAEYKVGRVEKKEVQKHPSPPFVTSTLQQEGVNKLYFSAKQTMQIAQQLYEGINLGKDGSGGLITYMRTDSTNLAQEAIDSIGKYIEEEFGKEYLPPTPRIYKTKSKGAQEAHEAIRPTNISYSPERIKEHLTPQQFKLYDLIWRRTLACQMASAVLATVAADVEAKNKDSYTLRANGSQIKFDGFLKIYEGKVQENILPALEKDEPLDLLKLQPDQHFTQPPARYNEASLIKTLEGEGVGRPSTYAPTITTIQDRNYVNKDENRRFFPTEIGFTVNDILVEHFPEVVDIKFTAHIEEDFDKIAEGEIGWTEVIKEFYTPFKKNLGEKYDNVANQKPVPEVTDKVCPKCGAPLLLRTSRFGKFYACSKFPECRYTESADKGLGIFCPKCVEGKIVTKRTRRGKTFYACSRYPDCDFALWDKPTGQKCPDCNSLLVEHKSGIKCSNKECKYKESKSKLED
jgi:DNA topoisomerase-1